MFTGFAAAQMAMYHAASVQRDYDRDDSFQLCHPSGKQWSYSLGKLVDILAQKSDDSPYHLISCEPNWIYPLCNMIGASAIKSHAPEIWLRQEQRFRTLLEEEFMTIRGEIIPCRSAYAGFALPVFGGVMPQALPCLYLNAILPDIALRQWVVLRDRIIKEGNFLRDNFWRIDTGNYRFSRAAAYASTALAAIEMGDEEIYHACLMALDNECPVRTDNGYFYRPKASLWAHAVEFFARSNTHNGFQTLMTRSYQGLSPPHVGTLSYHEVTLASAHYHQEKLRVVLYPNTVSGNYAVGIAGLVPYKTYGVNGAHETCITADNLGNAEVNVYVDGRSCMELYQSE